MKKKFLITEEERIKIRRMYNLIIEEKTPDEIKKEFKTRFPCVAWQNITNKFKEENGKSIVTYFDKFLKGNMKLTIDGEAEVLDGLYVGRKENFWCEGDTYKEKTITKSAAETEVENKLESFPCITKEIGTNYLIRKTSDGKYFIGFSNALKGRTWCNLDDKTYFDKGGTTDGEKGSWSCEGDTVKWDKTQAGTTKKVIERETPISFGYVTKDYPIIRGMRDNDEEGLIYQIQKKLKELGKYKEEPDGQFGRKTYDAVVAFQKENKDENGNPLVPDGKVGPITLKAMGFIR
jgi:hypothetical protein